MPDVIKMGSVSAVLSYPLCNTSMAVQYKDTNG